MKIDVRKIGDPEDLDDLGLPTFEAISVPKNLRGRRPQDGTGASQASANRARARMLRNVRGAIETLGLPEISLHEFCVIKPHAAEDARSAKAAERKELKRLRFKKPSERIRALKFQK